jgi:hypothetical protein
MQTRSFFRPFRRWAFRALAVLALLLAGPTGMLIADARTETTWSSAARNSAKLAPDPAHSGEAVIQAYAARAWGWRGAFAVHTWIATKAPDAESYTVHHVVGWRGGRKVVSRKDVPDRHWYGAEPVLLADLRGPEAAALIGRVEAAVAAYPFAETYTAFPGPNSNTFTAWIARAVPELGLELPAHAIGKDYLGPGRIAARAPSGTGYQLSLYGLAGIMLARDEGAELNILGLSIGLDPEDFNLKLPGIGWVGPTPSPARGAAAKSP